MNEFLPVMAVIVGGGLALGAFRSRLSSVEFRVLLAAFAAHLLAAVAQVVLTRDVLGGGDMFAYHFYGDLLADLIVRDPGAYLSSVVGLVFHDSDPALPLNILGAGGATGSMFGISALLHLVCAGSIYAVCMTLSIGTLFGTVGLYLAVRPSIDERNYVRVLAACVLMPSVVYWSSGLLKEAVAFVGFGWCVLAVRWLVDGRRIQGVALFSIAAMPPALVKPYILFPLALAGGVWLYWDRAVARSPNGMVTIRPWYLVVSGVVAFIGVVVLSRLFPEYSVDVLSDEIAKQQDVGTRTAGTANYQLGDAPSHSVAGQMLLAPLALLTSLFRPFFFEARNAPQLVNALETGWLTLLAGKTLVSHGNTIIERVRRSPMLAFCVVFIVVFGTLVGLATTNLGTLSRYRIPLTPLFAVVLLILQRRPRSSALPISSRVKNTHQVGVEANPTSGSQRFRSKR